MNEAAEIVPQFRGFLGAGAREDGGISRYEMRLMERAARHGWSIPKTLLQKGVDSLERVLDNPKTGPTKQIAAVRTLAVINQQNIDLDVVLPPGGAGEQHNHLHIHGDGLTKEQRQGLVEDALRLARTAVTASQAVVSAGNAGQAANVPDASG